MTTIFDVKSSICGYQTKITVEKIDAFRMSVNLETTCKKIKEYSREIRELSMIEVCEGYIKNPVYTRAVSSHMPPDCLVPCGVVMATWTEAGMKAKSLLQSAGPHSITFIK